MTGDVETPEGRDTGRPLTGRKFLAIMVGAFSIIIGVNVYMATQAVSTFPGMEVSSSYADSQTFDDRRLAQEELGWQASVDYADGILRLTLVDEEGRPVYPAELSALVTRPTSQQDDHVLDLARGPNGVLMAPVELEEGAWRLRLTGTARNGADYRHNITFTLR